MPTNWSVSEYGLRDVASAWVRPEQTVVKDAINIAALDDETRNRTFQSAHALVQKVRSNANTQALIDGLLQEYNLSSEEGIVLMRLCEALIRTPDFATSRQLIRDKLSDARWHEHAGKSDLSAVNFATRGLRLTGAWITASGGAEAKNLLAKLGDRVLNAAMERAMSLMGNHFVLGATIDEALVRAANNDAPLTTYSFDMLGESAKTHDDAARYFDTYKKAALALAAISRQSRWSQTPPSISVKLSALHPRYELNQMADAGPVLVDRLRELAQIARDANFGLTIDAEESERLEASLMIFHNLLADNDLADWNGLGIVVQAYQRRAIAVIRWLVSQTQSLGRAINVRLVKGAYWDSEIKRAQELGLSSYPVFTRKSNTDVNYLACARLLLEAEQTIHPQFATHNAQTVASILEMAREHRAFEFQRLHGMGETLHAIIAQEYNTVSRIYAPVGAHEDLLPYLVRRLLENGANSSFVHQLLDPKVAIEDLAADPISETISVECSSNPKIPTPCDYLGGTRLAASGDDLTQGEIADAYEAKMKALNMPVIVGMDAGPTAAPLFNPASRQQQIGSIAVNTIDDIDLAIDTTKRSDWAARSATERAAILHKVADRLERDNDIFIQLCVLEAGKTLPDAIAEIREAVDFCRYYALQAQSQRIQKRAPLGTIACISPWNFPLAIFLGQITAALSVGNCVIAKSAEQTPLIAQRAVVLLHECGVPRNALHLLTGDGLTIGAPLVRHQGINGVCFTGSTQTAKHIALSLTETDRALTPFIAETGGINAMFIDSTALLEQAVEDAVTSAFQSAGQRCSACRLICVQDDIADDFLTMLAGKINTIRVGDPAVLRTDIGPVIDADAHDDISTYIDNSRRRFSVIGEADGAPKNLDGYFIAPIAFEIEKIADLTREVFGPVLHVMRYPSLELEQTLSAVNALGYGLTMGLHTRLDDRAAYFADHAHVGNLYINRNQIGAVVGVQPFGGEGLSGTGPKAGGPHYLLALTKSENAENADFEAKTPLNSLTITPSKDEDLRLLIDASHHAAHQWYQKTSIRERFKTVMEALKTTPSVSSLNEETTLNTDKINLPGPTGERNSLRLRPRGALALFGAPTAELLVKQLAFSLSAGNSLLVAPSLNDISHRKMIEIVKNALPTDVIVHLTPEQFGIVLHDHIGGVVIDGDARNAIGEALTKRTGAIIPVLSALDAPERFFHERTVTINSAAAGGNTDLLASA